MPKELDAKEKILEAAKGIFYKKGLGGARMAEIAEEAGINKAMLHYYFSSKEQLFETVFEEAFHKIIPSIISVLNSEKPIREKIEEIADFYITTLSANPQLPVFVLNAIQYDPERFLGKFMKNKQMSPQAFMGKLMQQFQQEIQEGKLPPVDPRHLIINLIGLSVFPFMMKPMLKIMMNMDDESFHDLMESRRELIPRFLLDT